jgi:hypothetical protein
MTKLLARLDAVFSGEDPRNGAICWVRDGATHTPYRMIPHYSVDFIDPEVHMYWTI